MNVITQRCSNSGWFWSLILFDALLTGHAALISGLMKEGSYSKSLDRWHDVFLSDKGQIQELRQQLVHDNRSRENSGFSGKLKVSESTTW